MNILFLIPPSPAKRRIVRMIDCSYESKTDYLWQPNDYLMISSLLSPDDHAVLIDGTADRLDINEFFKTLPESPPDLLFFALSSVCWEWDYAIFQKIRAQYADTPLYLIGDVFLEDDYLRFITPHCQGVVYIPYLLNLPAMALLTAAKDDLPGLRTPSSARQDSPKKTIPVSAGTPRHELFTSKGYLFPFARHLRFATITTFWGCPFSCFYCNQNSIPPVVRPWQEVVKELEYVHQLGIRELFFADKAFGFPPNSILPLLEEMATRFKFSWSCYFHPQMYRVELIDKMHAAGCHTLIVGIDSSNLAGLQQYSRTVKPEQLQRLLDHANRLGMEICADFIIGLEHENEQEIQTSIDYALQLPIDFASFNIAAPLPGSGIRKKATASGQMSFGEEGYDTLARAGVMVASQVSQERILALRRAAVRRFYLRPSYWWRRLSKTASLEHLLIQCRQMTGMLGKH